MTAPDQQSIPWPRLAPALAEAVGASRVTLTSVERLAGGAVQENWRIDADVADGPDVGTRSFVLRTGSHARLPVSLDTAAEARVVQAAHAGGVRVARMRAAWAGEDQGGPLPKPAILQDWLPGTAHARRIVRDPDLAAFGSTLAAELARELARIHDIARQGGPTGELSCLPRPIAAPAKAEVERLRGVLAKAGERRPALEYSLAWLDQYAPPARPLVLVHGDFRTGNYLVDGRRLAGVLDWEFAHWGDPDEDIGWFSARCWRFGNDALEAGGIAPLAAFLDAYRTASGRAVSPDSVRYWQIMAAAKWATIAVLQGDRLRRGGERRLELALTGLMPAEMEHDALSAILAWKEGPTWP